MFKTKVIANSALSLAAVLVCGSQAQAAQYDLGNPDLSMRWDNTLRYNLHAASAVSVAESGAGDRCRRWSHGWPR